MSESTYHTTLVSSFKHCSQIKFFRPTVSTLLNGLGPSEDSQHLLAPLLIKNQHKISKMQRPRDLWINSPVSMNLILQRWTTRLPLKVRGFHANDEIAHLALLSHFRPVVLVEVSAGRRALFGASILSEAALRLLYLGVECVLLSVPGAIAEGVDCISGHGLSDGDVAAAGDLWEMRVSASLDFVYSRPSTYIVLVIGIAQHLVETRGVELEKTAIVQILQSAAVLVETGVCVAIVQSLSEVVDAEILLHCIRAAACAVFSVPHTERQFIKEAATVPLFDDLAVLGAAEILDRLQRHISVKVVLEWVLAGSSACQFGDGIAFHLDTVRATTLSDATSSIQVVVIVLA